MPADTPVQCSPAKQISLDSYWTILCPGRPSTNPAPKIAKGEAQRSQRVQRPQRGLKRRRSDEATEGVGSASADRWDTWPCAPAMTPALRSPPADQHVRGRPCHSWIFAISVGSRGSLRRLPPASFAPPSRASRIRGRGTPSEAGQLSPCTRPKACYNISNITRIFFPSAWMHTGCKL